VSFLGVITLDSPPTPLEVKKKNEKTPFSCWQTKTSGAGGGKKMTCHPVVWKVLYLWTMTMTMILIGNKKEIKMLTLEEGKVVQTYSL